MNTSDERYEAMKQNVTGVGRSKAPQVMEAPEEINLGPCAAIAKDKWVKALTIKHIDRPWESFQFVHIGARSEYTPTRFMVEFVGDAAKWRVTVAGRNLERIYNLCIQGRLEWLRVAHRDFAASDSPEPIVTGIEVEEVEDED